MNHYKITDRQAAKKVYHKGFGIDYTKYGITQAELTKMRDTKGGLIEYVRKGGKLPPIGLIREYQHKVKDMCQLSPTNVQDAKHYGKNTGTILAIMAIMFYNRQTRQIALFN